MTAIDASHPGLSAAGTAFRTCRFTGLKVDIAAQRLIKVNAVAAVIFLAVGGLILLFFLGMGSNIHHPSTFIRRRLY